ncbi:MAG: hypothetical protein AAF098_19415 [Pseudomonadota bacterium]
MSLEEEEEEEEETDRDERHFLLLLMMNPADWQTITIPLYRKDFPDTSTDAGIHHCELYSPTQVVINRGAMHIAVSSWNKSLQA